MGLEKRKKTAAVFFDIEKTFNKINRNKTFEKLEKIVIQERIMEFIRELISKRWIKVRVGGSTLMNKQTDQRIPQEQYYTTLFLLTINSILVELRNEVEISLFTNNQAIYITTRIQKVKTRTLQGVINNLDAWAEQRGLSFFTSKTVNMIHKKREKINKKIMKITLRNQIIPYEENTQFLRKTRDSRLNWVEHIDRVRAKAKRKTNTIKLVAGKKQGGEYKTLNCTVQHS